VGEGLIDVFFLAFELLVRCCLRFCLFFSICRARKGRKVYMGCCQCKL